MKHTMPAHLLQRPAIRVVVVGCGGNGSVMAMGLPYIHQGLLLSGHAGGLDVTLIDGDVVSPTNCVRQPFSQSEIGLSKSVVLASRINLFWGLRWKAIQGHVSKSQKVEECDIVISCVDTRSARAGIDKLVGGNAGVTYWLDLGNGADGGQFVLGHGTDAIRGVRNDCAQPANSFPKSQIQHSMKTPLRVAAPRKRWNGKSRLSIKRWRVMRWPCLRDSSATASAVQ